MGTDDYTGKNYDHRKVWVEIELQRLVRPRAPTDAERSKLKELGGFVEAVWSDAKCDHQSKPANPGFISTSNDGVS